MRIFVVFADGFEEIEALTVVDILRRAGIKVDMVGIPGTTITGSHGVRISMDKKLVEVKADEYNGVVLPGGKGYLNLMRTAPLLELIKQLNARGKLVAAICAAPAVLAKAGVLENRKATIYPGMEKELPYPRSERVIADGNIVTAQGPGTAMEFALKLVELLAGREKASELEEQLLV